MAKIVYPAVSEGTVGETLQPRRINFKMYKGDDFEVNIALTDRRGQTINLRGWTAVCQLRKGTEVKDAVVTIKEDGISFDLFVPNSVTETMTGTYKYDVEFTQPNGRKRTYLYGEVAMNGIG